jgi:hypothetical protein
MYMEYIIIAYAADTSSFVNITWFIQNDNIYITGTGCHFTRTEQQPTPQDNTVHACTHTHRQFQPISMRLHAEIVR